MEISYKVSGLKVCPRGFAPMGAARQALMATGKDNCLLSKSQFSRLNEPKYKSISCRKPIFEKQRKLCICKLPVTNRLRPLFRDVADA